MAWPKELHLLHMLQVSVVLHSEHPLAAAGISNYSDHGHLTPQMLGSIVIMADKGLEKWRGLLSSPNHGVLFGCYANGGPQVSHISAPNRREVMVKWWLLPPYSGSMGLMVRAERSNPHGSYFYHLSRRLVINVWWKMKIIGP